MSHPSSAKGRSHDPDVPSESAEPATRVEMAVLALAVAAYLVVHSFFTVPLFGEPDGARMTIDAASFHFSGKVGLDATDYRMRTSPLYIHALKLAMDHGVSLGGIPVLMTRVSLVSSAVTLLAIYVLFRRIIGRSGAAVATGLLGVTPGFWLAGSYGMAHGPSLSAWILGLLAFSRALDAEGTPRFWKLSGLATVLVFMAVALKADIVVNGLAFPGLAFVRRKLTLRNAIVASAVVVGGLAIQMLYVKGIVTAPPPAASLPAQESAAKFTESLTKRFPFELRGLTDKIGFGAITHAPGPFLFSLGLIALLSRLTSRRHVRIGLLAMAWGLPIVIFWGLIIGNSARHNLSALPPLVLVVASLVVELTEPGVRAALFALALAAVNYFSETVGEPNGFGTVVPKTNLLELSRDLVTRSADLEKWARGFGKLREPKKALVARSSLPFAVYETMLDAAGRARPIYDGKDLHIVFPDGHAQVIKTVYILSPRQATAAVQELRGEGYTVWRHDW
jgi:hypothetical protein